MKQFYSHSIKRGVLIVAAFAAAFPFLTAHSDGVAEHQDKDRTGAPGSDTPCFACHDDQQFSPELTVEITDPLTNEPISMYVPGEVYQLTFSMTSSGASVYGFQATALLDDNSNAGTFQNPGALTQLEDVSGRHIIEHSDANPSGVFTGEWVAPAEGSGDVTIYASGMSGNGNNASSGDGYDGLEIVISEDQTISVAELGLQKDFNALLANGQLNLTIPQSGQIELYQMNGQLIKSMQVQEGRVQTTLDGISGIIVVSYEPQNGVRVVQKLLQY